MPILLVELNTDEVLVDESLFPNKDSDSFVYEHLRHYCSKFYPLPTISVRVYPESVVVTRGHFYLLIAKELGSQRIRAVIDSVSPEDLVAKFLQKPSVIQLDWKAIRQEESNNLYGYNWYVFFFETPLNTNNKNFFEDEVVKFFTKINFSEWAEVPDQRIKNLSYPCSGRCAEFQAYIPIADESWYARARAVATNFHLKCVPIISFQGQKFQVK